jgi:hypothetical protein
MSSLCELTNAELDLVSGGALLNRPELARSSGCRHPHRRYHSCC